jgi:hypothetical protein
MARAIHWRGLTIPWNQRKQNLQGLLENQQQNQCWFCLGEENEGMGPWIQACGCKGVSAFVHQNCIDDYVSVKVSEGRASVKCPLCQVSLEYEQSGVILNRIQKITNQAVLMNENKIMAIACTVFWVFLTSIAYIKGVLPLVVLLNLHNFMILAQVILAPLESYVLINFTSDKKQELDFNIEYVPSGLKWKKFTDVILLIVFSCCYRLMQFDPKLMIPAIIARMIYKRAVMFRRVKVKQN